MEKQIIEITKDILQVSDVSILKRFLGGMSNFTYLVQAGTNFYTVRIPGKNSEVFISRSIEKVNLSKLKAIDITNETIYLNTSTGIKIAKYLDGVNIFEVDPLDYLEEVSEALHTLHKTPFLAINNYRPFDRINNYEELVLQFNHVYPKEYFQLKKQVFSLQKQYQDIPLVLTHGDSQPSNMVFANKKIYLLDFEFMGNNDPYYDIACFGNIDFSNAKKLLDIYLGYKAKNKETKRLIYNRMIQCLQWHNVALYKEYIGLSQDLKIDFKKVSNMYLEKCAQLYQEYLSLGDEVDLK